MQETPGKYRGMEIYSLSCNAKMTFHTVKKDNPFHYRYMELIMFVIAYFQIIPWNRCSQKLSKIP